MSIATSYDADENFSYFYTGEYDTVAMTHFMNEMASALSYQGLDSGDTDRLDAMAMIGQNSIYIRLDLAEMASMQHNSRASALFVEAESQTGETMAKNFYYQRNVGESVHDATIRWIESCRAYAIMVCNQLFLPFTIPPGAPPVPILTAPASLVPSAWASH
jgi:hypothetical protein